MNPVKNYIKPKYITCPNLVLISYLMLFYFLGKTSKMSTKFIGYGTNAEAGAEILAGHIDKYVRVPFFSVNMGQSDAVRQYRIWWLCVATGLL